MYTSISQELVVHTKKEVLSYSFLFSVFLMTLNVIFLKKNDIEIWRTILRFGKKIQNLHFYSVGFQKFARRAKKNNVHLRAKKNTVRSANVFSVIHLTFMSKNKC